MQRLTKEQAIILTGYTGITCCAFHLFHEDVEKRVGRPVFTHEMGTGEFMERVRDLYRDDFMALVYAEGEHAQL